MRKRLGMRLAVSVVGGAAFAAWIAACSGSDQQDVVTPTPDATPEAALPDTFAPDVQNDVVLDVVKDTGPIYDAGPANVLEAGPEYEGGIPCVVGGVLEVEPNDTKATANTLAPTVCGALLVSADAGADGGIESDFLTFTLPSTATNFYIQFSGDISMKVDVEGNPSVTITPTMAATIPFVKEKPYYIEVRSLTNKRVNWRVTVFQN